MSRSPPINALPIFGLLILSTVLSASREELIAQPRAEGERHITRQAEVLEESLRRFRNDGSDVRPREPQFSHRLARLAKESSSSSNGRVVEKSAETNLSRIEKKDNNSTLSVDKLEIKDMMEAHVTPQDDDDDDEIDGKATTREKPLETVKDKSSVTNTRNSTPDSSLTTALPPPEVFPDDNTTAEIRIVTPEWYAKLNMTAYTTNASDANSTSGATTVPVLVMTISPSSDAPTKVRLPVEGSTTTSPTTESNATMIERTTDEPTATSVEPAPSSYSPAEMKLHEKKIPVAEPMPSGVAALIAAISFAMIVIVVYIGILVRKRYFEWRYGNRELLVNDFDAADMSNFEL